MANLTGANPYDCQNPVTDPAMFAGRRAELKEIEYYLDQALVTRPTNLAFIGARGSGKTSLLQMTGRLARDRGLMVVDIRFDESHATSQLSFFFHVIDCIMNAAIKERRADGEMCFGGPGGRMFMSYINAAYAYQEVSPEDLGLMFPLVYAAHMRRGGDGAVLPQTQFSQDLVRIAEEVGRPIVLLLDECNVVTQRRDVLQALRNIFQTQSRYMLVMAGTESLFPAIDEVFSPVGRGFKQIAVDRFAAHVETYECMRKPLAALGMGVEPVKAFAPQLIEYGEVTALAPQPLQDLHHFTSGKPLEILRACHFMYRDMQLRGTQEMRLEVSVLDAVLRDLASSHDRHELLGRLKSLSRQAKVVMSVLSEFASNISIDAIRRQLWVQSVLMQSDACRDEDLQRGIHELAMRELVVVDDGSGHVRWIAGELESLMAKYVLRGEGFESLSFRRKHYDAHLCIPILRRSALASHLCAAIEAEANAMLVWYGPASRQDDPLKEVLSDGEGHEDIGCLGTFVMVRLSVHHDDTMESVGGCWLKEWPSRLRSEVQAALAPACGLIRDSNERLANAGLPVRLDLEVMWFERSQPICHSPEWAATVCAREQNQRSLWWVQNAAGQLLSELLSCGVTPALRVAVCLLVAGTEDDGPRHPIPIVGFLALACADDGARDYLNEVWLYEEFPLDLGLAYNTALSFLLGDSPDLPTALVELEQVVQRCIADANECDPYRALLRVEFVDGNTLQFRLWKAPVCAPAPGHQQPRTESTALASNDDGSAASPKARLSEFARASIAAISAALASGKTVRVRPFFEEPSAT